MLANKTRKSTIFENLIVDGSKLNTGPNSSTPLAGIPDASISADAALNATGYSG